MGHDHAHTGSRGRLAVVFALTLTVALAQLVGSFLTGSLALLTDTVHAFVDASGLLLALSAATLMHRPATSRRTWGFLRLESLAALAQSTLLIGVGVYAIIEGVRRLFDPPEIPATELFVYGLIGLCANVAGIVILSGSKDANLNFKAAFLEVLNDALGSLGVVIAAVVIWTTGFTGADAIAALFIAVPIVPRAVIILRQSVSVLLESTPEHLDLTEVKQHLEDVDHVLEVHDLHASTIVSGLTTLTAHLVVDDECFRDGHAPEVLRDAQLCAAEHFDPPLAHVTFQLEPRSDGCVTECQAELRA